MAKRAAMSPRTLQRQCRDATAPGPVAWLIRERIALVKDWLQTSDATSARIAERTAFGSEESLRHHFKRLVATTPGAYCKRFSVATSS